MSSARKFRSAQLPRQSGELARIKVVKGPDYGSTFVLIGVLASAGRGEENDIVLTDLKTSRKHLELRMVDSGVWEARDLGSANGISINGKGVATSRLKTGDTILIGESLLEFATADAGTRVLAAPPRDPAEIERANSALEAQRKRVQLLGNFGPMGSPSVKGATSSAGKGEEARRVRLLLIAAAGVALYFWVPGESEKPAKSPRTQTSNSAQSNAISQELASMIPEGPKNPAAEMFFRTGFREYQSGNFLRAKTAFENVLMVSPGHRLARLYLENSIKEIDGEVKYHLERAGRDRRGGRLKNSRAHYQAVLRLLHMDHSNPAHATAREELENLEREIRGEPPLSGPKRDPARSSKGGQR